MPLHSRFVLGLFLCAAIAGTSAVAAAERRGPLDGQPAVRHREELRTGRFEIGPSFAFSLNRTYRHVFTAGAKLGYYITDYLSLGAEIAAGVPFDSAFTNEIKDSYTPSESAEWNDRHGRMSDIKMAGDIRAVFTPFAGKMSLFSALFLNYDFYAFAGFGMALLANNSNDPGVDATNEGFRPGVAWGLGMHVWANRFVAIGLELKDLIFEDNETGGDRTRGLTSKEQAAGGFAIVDADDRSYINHLFIGINATFFLPTRVTISP